TDPSGATQQAVNDPAGLPLRLTDPLGHTTTLERDAFGRPVRLTDPLGATTRLTWTVEGKLATRTEPDGVTQSWTYDGEGNCVSHTDANGGDSRFEYTHFDLLAARVTPDGVRHEFRYDTELRLTEVRNPQGLTWNYLYDAAGRLIAESDFDNRTQTYAHDPAGRLTSRTTPLGERIAYTYDSLGRILTKDVAGAVTHFTYDAAGRLASATTPTSTLTLRHDPLGRLLAETVDGRTTHYTYDSLGRRLTRTTPTGATTRLAYDAAGNRTSLDIDGHALTFTHDELGREHTRSFGLPADPLTLTTTWNPAGQLTAQTLTATSTGRALRSRAYTYRADRYLTSVTDQLTGDTTTYTLDPVGRPLTVSADNWSETYAYDAAGNQTAADWPDRTPDASARGERTYVGTRIQAAGAIRYTHDAAGRTTVRRKTRLSRRPDTWHYTYDAEDRLTSCTTPDGAFWTYTYDPLGRRTAKLRWSTDRQTVVEHTTFTWDGTRLAEQTDTATGVTLTWDHEGHRPLTQLERKPSTLTPSEVDSRFFAIVTDLVGTPTELVDETGHIAWHTRTTLWGTTTWNRDATAYTPLRFPGQYADHETGLHYNLHRHYDPTT
ncbi:RHS repeat-associated core domain-containing protein, partial [Streptomyces alkaliterrae]